MKPDIEINGRYFVEGEIDGTYRNVFLKNDIKIPYYQLDQSLPLGKCFVELETFSNLHETGVSFLDFKIKIQDNKAVVLTELPEKEICCHTCHCSNSECKFPLQRMGHEEMKRNCNSEDFHVITGKMPDGKSTFKSEVINDGEKEIRTLEIEIPIEQSPDELAEKVFNYTIETELIGETYCMTPESVIKAMQEYHRVKSEGLFTKEDMIELICWLNNKTNEYPEYLNRIMDEDIFNHWLETRKNK